MRVTKEEAKLVIERPAWLDRDDHWDLFQNYRDTDLSFDLLAPLHGVSRSLAHQVVLKILTRIQYHGLSVRARNTLKVVNSWHNRQVITDQRLRDDLRGCLTELYDLANSVISRKEFGGHHFKEPLPNRYLILKHYLLTCVNDCGFKTSEEILSKFEEVCDAEFVCGVPDWVFTARKPAA